MNGKLTSLTTTTMAQHNMLKHYLIPGLIFSLTLVISSCKDDFYNQYGQYYFVNETDYHITYNSGLEAFNIPPKSTTVFEEKTKGEGKKISEVSNFKDPFIRNEVVTIKFNNVKCLLNVKKEDAHSVRNINSYTAKRIDDYRFQFTFTFTEADYNRAVNCP